MKKYFNSLNLSSAIYIFLLIVFSTEISAQVIYDADFNGCTMNNCGDWNWSSATGQISGTPIGVATPCAMADPAAVMNLNITTPTAMLSSTVSLGTSTGDVGTFSFDYKVSDVSGATEAAASGGAVEFQIEYATSVSGPWTSAGSFLSTSSAMCQEGEIENFLSTPMGQPLFFRIVTTRNSGDLGVVIDNISFNQQPLSTISNTDCKCNSSPEVGMTDGTYISTIVIQNPDDSPMPSGLIYTVVSSTNLTNPNGTALGNPTFNYCNTGCPEGVNMGEYFLEVEVGSSGIIDIEVDGPDADSNADTNTSLSTVCTTSTFPMLPVFPADLMDVNCILDDLVLPNPNGELGVTYSYSNTSSGINLPPGFSVDNGTLTISKDDITPDSNNPYTLFLIAESLDGCTVMAMKEFEIYEQPVIVIEPKIYDCMNSGQKVNLFDLLNPESTFTGEFIIDGSVVENSQYEVTQEECITVTYRIDDPNCGLLEETTTIYVRVLTDPQFDLSGAISPVCSDGGTISVGVSVTSSGSNQELTLDGAPFTGTTLMLDGPSSVGTNDYKICLKESGSAPMTCSGITFPADYEICTKETCKTFSIYNDGAGCGADALFTDNCEIPEFDLCPAAAKPRLALACGALFALEIPFDIVTVDVDMNTTVISCTTDEVCGSFNATLLGLDISGNSGPKLGDIEPFDAICGVLNTCFEFDLGLVDFEICPLSFLAEVFGCDKSFVDIILDGLATLAGGNGGGFILVADTDGDGAFDYQLDADELGISAGFPASSDFCVPNNLKGAGEIKVRLVAAFPDAPIDVCGNLVSSSISLLDLLPLGSIPVLGSILEDILASLSCDIDLAFSNVGDAVITVFNSGTPTFETCNESGFSFSESNSCDVPVNWSVPVAVSSCDEQSLSYKGVTSGADLTYYEGASAPTPTTITEDGIYQTAGPVPGSDLPPGVYVVTYTAVGCNGNPSQCTFTVTVTNDPVSLTCPGDLTFNTDSDECTRVLNGLMPYQGIDECNGILNYTINSPSGAINSTTSTMVGDINIPDGFVFELGTSEVEYTLQIDLNGDGDFGDADETQMCTFDVIIEDDQKPEALCVDLEVQLDNEGAAMVFAQSNNGPFFVDGGSSDNCSVDDVSISRDGVTYSDTVSFSCDDLGLNYVRLLVEDESGNTTECYASVNVIDYFSDFTIDLDLPEICFEPFQDTIDFSDYILISTGDGTNVDHHSVSTLGASLVGGFGISAFSPDPGSTTDPGTITQDGVYTIGTGTGFITVSYVLALEGQINSNPSGGLEGCYILVHDVFRIQKLDPVWKGGFVCCDQTPIFLGGANWDGTGDPVIPDGLINLEDIRGEYPGDVQGEWTGQGVSFQDPDGINFSGDEYFQFDPSGLDASITLTYTIGDEPCIFDYSQEILVTCQDLGVELNDTTVCPATFIDNWVIITNLDDDDVVVTTTGLAAVGGVDLTDEPVVDGQVTIPGFQTVAVRNETYTIGVTINQTTDFGCLDYFTFNITVRDTLPPFFQNCPKPPITVEALPDLCGNFVNFEDPFADDNCFSLYTDIEQVDTTGLISGSMFPVGTTILAYTATDTVGNQSYCEVKIVVNDFEQDPMIECPEDIETVNDLGQCSAVVNDIVPPSYEDNCGNNTVIYEVNDENGDVLFCGFEDASANVYPVGTSTVTYSISDQSLILITEIVQDGITTGIELTNFGPSKMDITCGQVAIYDATGMTLDSFLIPTRNNKSTEVIQLDFPPLPTIWDSPSSNLLDVGESWTYTFDVNPAVGEEVHYVFSFLERTVDEVTINDEVESVVFLRETICDHDTQTDFIPATPCDPGSFGFINPGLPTMTYNGDISTLQLFDANIDTCSFDIVVDDIEAPICIMHDSIDMNAEITTPLVVNENSCLTSDIIMPAGIVNDVNVNNIQITTSDVGKLTVYLNSPSGTRILLFDELCDGEADVDVTLDLTDGLDKAPSILTAPCGPLGNGGVYSAKESLKEFFREESGGVWQLEMYITDGMAEVTNWELEVLLEEPYAQQDTIIENDTLLCSAVFTWTHPVFRDNCCEGEMIVEYAFSNDVTGMSNSVTETIQSFDELINIDGTIVTRVFEVGTTVITYTKTDQYGNVSQCSFSVIVNDTEEPRYPIGCRDWTVNLNGGICYGALPLVPEVLDNCDIDSISYCFPDGSLADVQNLPIGANVITMKTVDIYGNVGTCEFIVDIAEFVPSSAVLACNNEINLSLDFSCSAELTVDMILEGNEYRCYENYCMEVTDITGEETHSNIFGVDDIGQTFIVSIVDCLGEDLSCWGYVNIEEKFIPEILCPNDTVLYCNVDPTAVDEFGQLLTGTVEVLTCETFVDINYQDHLENFGDCSTPRAQLKRRWSVEDGEGNIVYCDQFIEFRPYDISQVAWPEDINGVKSISCGLVLNNPMTTMPDSTGYPTINGLSMKGQHFCDINVGHQDLILDDANCESGYEILRSWYIRNECEPLVPGVNPLVHIQSIKVNDLEAPIILELPDVTVSTDPWTCQGSVLLPEVVHADDCSGHVVNWYTSYGKVVGGTTLSYLNVGETEVVAFVHDNCGNSTQASFNVTVVDDSGPTVKTVQDLVVSLVPDGELDGSAKIFTYHIDNNSFDNCGDLRLVIRRNDPTECGNPGNNTFDDTFKDAEDHGQWVKFCCEDITNAIVDVNNDGVLDTGYVEVILRAYDENGNYNEAWSFVKVEDNTPPVINGPEAATIYCDWPIDDNFDSRTYTTRGSASLSIEYISGNGIDFSKTGEAGAYSTCGTSEIEFVDVIISTEGDGINQCGAGQFTRIFRTVKTDKNGNMQAVFAFQKITILGRNGDADVTQDIDNSGAIDADDIGPFIVGCDGPTQEDLNMYSPIIVGDDPCDVIGRSIEIDSFFFEQGVCKKWVVEYRFINWCDDQEWNNFVPVTFMYLDTEDPVVIGCQDTMYAQNDAANCQHALELENIATDNGGCAGQENAWLKWQVYVDLWGDGTIDAYGSSYGFTSSWRKTNSSNPALPSSPNWSPDVWVVNIEATGSGETTDIPALPKDLIQGNMNNHKVTWKVTDGCHNFASCSEEIMIVDKKAPTPYCRNISTAVMDGSDEVELWAIDFSVGSTDNCTSEGDLKYTFDGPQEGFDTPESTPNWNPDTRSQGKVFDCDNLPEMTVNMYVWDEKNNTDYCEVMITLIDNDASCPQSGGKFDVAGTISTPGGLPIADITTKIDAALEEYPRTTNSNQDGEYEFMDNQENVDYTLTAEKNTELLEGVNTLDLVKIQRHLLGLELLDNPYKVIAADIDNDESIRPGDLLSLRKAILGLTDEFTNNTSWRFVDGSQSNDDLSLVRDHIKTGALTADRMDENFIAVKVGDVDESIAGLVANGGIESRSTKSIIFVTDNRKVKVGEVVEITFTSEEFKDVYGYQFTMDLQGLEFAGVTAGLLNMTESNVGVLNSAVTVSYNDVKAMNAGTAEGLFTMSFVATEAGELSEMISSTSSVTRAEVYVGENLETVEVEIAMRGANTAVAQYELLQNEPNPFKTTTTIGYTRPTAGSADFTVLDVTGKVLMSRTVTGVAGYNEVTINKGDINVSGVLHYTLSTDEFTDTKKMIMIE